MKIAFLGTGRMGTGFIRRMLRNGHDVRVWNRSPEKAQALETQGAVACREAASAVEGVERIHIALSDDAAVDHVLESIRDFLPGTAWMIDHTTTAPSPTAERAARWARRGRVYLHAPVFMSPKNTEEGAGLLLVSGDSEKIEAVLPDLEQMASKVIRLGDKPELAAAFKLFGNLVLIGIQGIIADVVRLAHAVGVRPSDAVALFTQFNRGETLPVQAAKIAGGPYEPASFAVTMARKDVRLMIEEAGRHGVELGLMPLVANLYDEAIARGEGALDTTAAFRFPRGTPTLPDRSAGLAARPSAKGEAGGA
jgi:3-hydroxyisobutyrate dehydrogenase